MIEQDTIFALSSGHLPSGVAVIRISGPRAFSACEALGFAVPENRRAALKTIRNRNDQVIDRALVFAFRAPHSFTGEDCLEIHAHGGRAVVVALLDALEQVPGLRPAEAGEFTRQAYENGRMGLLEVEGLADLIGAETEMQRRLAIEHSSGALSSVYAGWSDRIAHARAMIEAELDFADEDDVPGSIAGTIWMDMAALETEINAHLALASSGEIIRDGLKVVIAGAPNVGKSSLMNALARREVAIVTDIAGTTRDILHVDLDIDGFAVRLYDTAGLRETDEVVEREGIRRALAAIGEADVLVALNEVGQTADVDALSSFRGDVLRVLTKRDLHSDLSIGVDLAISTVTGEGIDDLLAAIRKLLADKVSAQSLALPSRRRHVRHLRDCLDALKSANSLRASGLEVRADALRQAGDHLGRITGRVDVEDLLGRIFSEFCIGK